MAETNAEQDDRVLLEDMDDPRYQKLYDIVFYDMGYSENALRKDSEAKEIAIRQERENTLEEFKCFSRQRNRQQIIKAAKVASLGKVREALLNALQTVEDGLVMERMGWSQADSRQKFWREANQPPSDFGLAYSMFRTNLKDGAYGRCVHAIVNRAFDVVKWLIPKAECSDCDPSPMRTLVSCKHLIDDSTSPAEVYILNQFISSLEILHDQDDAEYRNLESDAPESKDAKVPENQKPQELPKDEPLNSLPEIRGGNPQLHRHWWVVAATLSTNNQWFSHSEFEEGYKKESFYKMIHYRRISKWLRQMSLLWPGQVKPLVRDGSTSRSMVYRVNPEWISLSQSKKNH